MGAQDVLFETKLASLCLMPKIIDEDYLGAESMAFVLKHAPECRRGGSDSAVIFTHTYDSVRFAASHSLGFVRRHSQALAVTPGGGNVGMRRHLSFLKGSVSGAAGDGARARHERRVVRLQAPAQMLPPAQA